MKKIFPFLLSLVLVLTIFVSAVPTHAASYVLDGDYTFKDTITLPSSGTVTYSINAIVNGFDLSQIILDANGMKFKMTGFTGNPYTASAGWGADMWKTVTFVNYTASADFYEWFTSNIVEEVVYCDGTGHAIKDVSFDDICDICSLPIREDLRLEKPTQCDGTWYCPVRSDYDSDGFCDVCGLPYVPDAPTTCDGTACSWADDNFDGTCDTCGLTLLAFNYDLLQYASQQIVHALGTWPNAIHWFISETGEDDKLWAYISESPFVYEDGVLSSPVMSYWATFSFNQQGRPVSSGWSHINANSPLMYHELVDSSANIDGLFPPTGGDSGSGSGGTTPPSSEDTGGIDGLDGLWDWLSNAGAWLKSIAEGIADLPSLIGDKIGEAFNTVKDGILEGIKSIFIPDAQEIETKFLGFVEDVGIILGANFDAFDSLFEVEKPLEDVYVDYSIPGLGEFHLKILEKEWIHRGVAFFRPVIRGWLMFLLVIFVWNNTLGLIRQAMPIAPSTPSETESITVSKSEKLGNGWTRTTSRSTRSKRR